MASYSTNGGTVHADFPYSVTIHVPMPTYRFALYTLRALAVDRELSPLVLREFALVNHSSPSSADSSGMERSTSSNEIKFDDIEWEEGALSERSQRDHVSFEFRVLKTVYRATTNRMLRVAVNGYMESLKLIVGVMEELDVDVLELEGDGDTSHLKGTD